MYAVIEDLYKGLDDKYKDWIFSKSLHVPNISYGQCHTFSMQMSLLFPELEFTAGLVWGNEEGIKRSYPHWWCKHKETGRIIDPTVSQFYQLTNLQYQEIEKEKEIKGKCLNCGGICYDNTIYCSEKCLDELNEEFNGTIKRS